MKTEFYLSTAVYKLDELIKLEGYKPKSKFGGECTALVVEQQLREFEAPKGVRNDRIDGILKKIEKELNTNNSDSEFFRNCRDVVANHMIRPPPSWKLKPKIWNYQLGFLAALVKDVIEKEKAPPKEDLSHLGYIGTESKRGNFFVKMTDKVEKDDYVIHKVVDKTGNRGWFYNYKTKCSGDQGKRLEVNDCFLMSATPSRHEMNRYENCKTTYFNRIVVLENKGNKITQRIVENVARATHHLNYIDESSKIG